MNLWRKLYSLQQLLLDTRLCRIAISLARLNNSINSRHVRFFTTTNFCSNARRRKLLFFQNSNLQERVKSVMQLKFSQRLNRPQFILSTVLFSLSKWRRKTLYVSFRKFFMQIQKKRSKFLSHFYNQQGRQRLINRPLLGEILKSKAENFYVKRCP